MCKAVLGAVLVVAAAILAAAPTLTLASHSVPSPRWFWDKDDDGIAESTDSVEYYQTAGTLWTTAKIDRLKAALNTWKNGTDWNPTYSCCSTNGVYINGSAGCLGSWPAGVLGVTCRVAQNKGSYYRLLETDIYLNTVGFTFSWIVEEPPPNQADAQGVLTHEIGHGIRLIDLYGSSNCPPGPTMCGDVVSLPYTMNYRSLASDDISAANTVYLP
jgi:hypothetical protein